MTRGGVPVKERRVREDTRMGVEWRERISVAKERRLVVKAEREMFFGGLLVVVAELWRYVSISVWSWLLCLSVCLSGKNGMDQLTWIVTKT